MILTVKEPLKTVKRAFWLAYKSAFAQGLGRLQMRPGITTEDDVWKEVYQGTTADDPTGRAYGDYVFGKMMKLTLEWSSLGVTRTVKTPDSTPKQDYQSWAQIYPSYDLLITEAETSLEMDEESPEKTPPTETEPTTEEKFARAQEILESAGMPGDLVKMMLGSDAGFIDRLYKDGLIGTDTLEQARKYKKSYEGKPPVQRPEEMLRRRKELISSLMGESDNELLRAERIAAKKCDCAVCTTEIMRLSMRAYITGISVLRLKGINKPYEQMQVKFAEMRELFASIKPEVDAAEDEWEKLAKKS